MIYGLTHTDNGEPNVRLSIAGKVAIGRPKGYVEDDGKVLRAPKKLDHFIFLKRDNGGWVDDPEVTEHYGESPTRLRIMLLTNTIEEAFKTRLAWWTRSQLVCEGDGHTATYYGRDGSENKQIACKYRDCKCYGEHCKPNGTLYFFLCDSLVLGSVYKITTSGSKSVTRIFSSLQQIYDSSGEVLRGIAFDLVVKSEIAFPIIDGRKQKKIIPVLHLEFTGLRGKNVISSLLEAAQKVTPESHQLVAPEDNAELAPEMSTEFYPRTEGSPIASRGSDTEPDPEPPSSPEPGDDPAEDPGEPGPEPDTKPASVTQTDNKDLREGPTPTDSNGKGNNLKMTRPPGDVPSIATEPDGAVVDTSTGEVLDEPVPIEDPDGITPDQAAEICKAAGNKGLDIKDQVLQFLWEEYEHDGSLASGRQTWIPSIMTFIADYKPPAVTPITPDQARHIWHSLKRNNISRHDFRVWLLDECYATLLSELRPDYYKVCLEKIQTWHGEKAPPFMQDNGGKKNG